MGHEGLKRRAQQSLGVARHDSIVRPPRHSLSCDATLARRATALRRAGRGIRHCARLPRSVGLPVKEADRSGLAIRSEGTRTSSAASYEQTRATAAGGINASPVSVRKLPRCRGKSRASRPPAHPAEAAYFPGVSARTEFHSLLAMQKVVGSNPISRFVTKPDQDWLGASRQRPPRSTQRAQRVGTVPFSGDIEHHREELAERFSIDEDLDVVAKRGGSVVHSGVIAVEPRAEIAIEAAFF